MIFESLSLNNVIFEEMSQIIMKMTLFEFTKVFISHKLYSTVLSMLHFISVELVTTVLSMLHRPHNKRFRCHVSYE